MTVRGPVATAALAALLTAIPAVAVEAATTTQSGRVTPAIGGPTSRFTVAFVTPIKTGITGSSVLFEDVEGANTDAASYQRKPCQSSFQADAAYAASGTRLTVTLRPVSRWCTGKYALAVLELKAPACYAERTCHAGRFRELGAVALRSTFRVR